MTFGEQVKYTAHDSIGFSAKDGFYRPSANAEASGIIRTCQKWQELVFNLDANMQNKFSGTQSSTDLPLFKLKPSLDPQKPDVLSRCTAALEWFRFGLTVIPLVPKHKFPATAWDPWLHGLSLKKIADYWAKNPTHEVGCIVGSDVIVFDADSPQATAALLALELQFNLSPSLVVKTKKGVHHYFRRVKGTFARSDSHSTEKYPERLDVKTGRSLIILPPSTGKTLIACEVSQVCELREATQDFIDAVFIHNGRAPVRPLIPPPESTPSVNEDFEPLRPVLAHIKALTDHIDPDIGYDDWLRALMAIFNSTGGSDAGLSLADRWSSKGSKYRGLREIETKWRSFRLDAPKRVTIATLYFMVEANGYDWIEICAAADEEEFEPSEIEVIEPNIKPLGAHLTGRSA